MDGWMDEFLAIGCIYLFSVSYYDYGFIAVNLIVLWTISIYRIIFLCISLYVLYMYIENYFKYIMPSKGVQSVT
jgi:hypothetical protein